MVQGLCDGLAAQVHVGGGLEEHYAVSAEASPLEAPPVRLPGGGHGGEGGVPQDLVCRHPAGVVPGVLVLAAWVSQADQEPDG